MAENQLIGTIALGKGRSRAIPEANVLRTKTQNHISIYHKHKALEIHQLQLRGVELLSGGLERQLGQTIRKHNWLKDLLWAYFKVCSLGHTMIFAFSPAT